MDTSRIFPSNPMKVSVGVLFPGAGFLSVSSFMTSDFSPDLCASRWSLLEAPIWQDLVALYPSVSSRKSL